MGVPEGPRAGHGPVARGAERAYGFYGLTRAGRLAVLTAAVLGVLGPVRWLSRAVARTVGRFATAGVQAEAGRPAATAGCVPVVSSVAGWLKVVQAGRLAGLLAAAQEEAPSSG